MKWKVPPMADDIDEEAARWSEVLREAGDDPSVREAFESWRLRSPAHAAAFRRARHARALAGAVADAPEIMALRRATMARASRARPRRTVWAYGLSIAASLFVAVLLGSLVVWPGASQRIYQEVQDAVAGDVHETGVGQRSMVTLEDGSVITLNTDSRVSVHYAPSVRAITLERGQALFKVAPDRARPFIVTADGRQVTALGTEFEVHVSGQLFEVTLLEGRVAVTRGVGTAAGAAPPMELHPGQKLIAVAAEPPQVRITDVKREVSWRHGQVVFEDDRLADAVAEMNRYSRSQVVLGDAQLASLKISGAFNTGDTATFVEALTAYFPIERAEHAGDTIVLKSRAPSRG
ncbi:FecR family protein [Luteimonas suaedae]|uniref:FecR family protein n=1 Tax=Luteimonas suaedae TaxID=2605430 RepID=UPI0011ED6C4A|nr:FecR domain-containing protein [Luteimonas suaedae]